jgi:hypothetical protein
MDRSFLTNRDIVDASRDFVCIRTATYEDEEEADFLKAIFTGRSGELENTVFCILGPDGEKKLIRAGRGPNFTFSNAKKMAEAMTMIAGAYQPKKTKTIEFPALPVMKDFRLGLNVAACDGLPCVVVLGNDNKQVDTLKKELSQSAWDEKVMGRFVFCTSTDINDLKNIAGLKSKTGIVVIEPDQYGLKGKVIQTIDAKADSESMTKALIKIADSFISPKKNHRQHVQQGIRDGVMWESKLPVTDPGSLGAMQRRKNRTRGKRGGDKRQDKRRDQ